MTFVFGAMMVVGLLYLLSVILGGLGEIFDFGLDSALDNVGLGWLLGIDGAVDALDGADDVGSIVDALDGADDVATSASADVQGVGCMTIASFMAVFGAIGVVGVLSERSLWLILVVGVVISYAVARLVTELLKYVYRQQDNTAYSKQDLVGKTARATINSAEGKTGEVMVEMSGVLKFPVREVNSAALSRGDEVLIVGVDGRYLQVQRTVS
jgi:membrane protein implicated in regulation of membrane protease activity